MLELHSLSIDYLSDIHKSITGNVAEYFYDFKDIEETREWITKAIIKHESGEKEEYVITDNEEFIGMISPNYPTPTVAEIGMWIAPTMQGKGYGKQSLELLFGLLQSKGITKVFYSTDKNNLASINLATSLGFERMNEDEEIVFVKKI